MRGDEDEDHGGDPELEGRLGPHQRPRLGEPVRVDDEHHAHDDDPDEGAPDQEDREEDDSPEPQVPGADRLAEVEHVPGEPDDDRGDQQRDHADHQDADPRQADEQPSQDAVAPTLHAATVDQPADDTALVRETRRRGRRARSMRTSHWRTGRRRSCRYGSRSRQALREENEARWDYSTARPRSSPARRAVSAGR